jgi:CRISPR/Cas system Type II protein with McrA/HNH and RuvC-like nuclease domain
MISKGGMDLSVCMYCKTSLDEYSRTVDHLYPKSRGGKLSNDNKVPCCGDCNKLKGNMSVVEFSNALNSFIFFNHRSISHLKKIKKNVDELIESRRASGNGK